ncbi:MAG: EamA family transporter [Verrucomicrobiota bacterium]|nr:EamA family transporter [Verrucomicrobiota bacterium]
MYYLLIVSVIWGFSFGLFKGYLTGFDPNFTAFARLSLALLPFLYWVRWRRLPNPILQMQLLGIGAIQFGIMYSAYNLSFKYLQAYQVAVFTIFTPLYVSVWSDARSGRFRSGNLLLAALAVAGTGLIAYRSGTWNQVLIGFSLMQLANVCFAIGQVEYVRLRPKFAGRSDLEIFAWVIAGGALITGITTGFSHGWGGLRVLQLHQVAVLIYLGVVATGLGFYWWNKGAAQVSTATLATFNNLKIPFAVAASIICFGEHVNWARFLIGSALLITALFISESAGRQRAGKGG